MLDEYELALHPLVPQSVAHNAKVLSNIRSITAFLFGAVAGTLGLESYPGFAFWALGTLLTTVLFAALRTEGDVKRFYFRPAADLWLYDIFGSFMSFVLMWALFYGMVRA